jgi:signal transduction histidine kinase/DNA-binding NarL/FixJ family response regulator
VGSLEANKPRVLLVDDTPANLVALSAALEPIGAELVEAQSGQQAIELVQANSFAAVLLDVQMPTMDGFETAARIRRLQRGKEVPIIFLTAIYHEPAFVIRGYQAGAADYMTKPLDVHVLRGRVKAFVDLFRQREAERRYRLESALDAAPAFVSILSVPGYLCEFGNAQYRRLFADGEIMGKSAAALGATSELMRALDRIVVTGEPFALDEFVLTLPEDAARHASRVVNVTLQPLRDAQNRIEAILSFAIDVTEQVEGRQVLERARAKAEAANRSKDEFLAMVSHELRTPLNSILGWASVARRKKPSPECDHALGVIERNARTQQQLIEALLDVSRAIAGNMRLQIGATDVGEILEQVIETLRPAAEGKAITVRVEGGDLDVIDADRDRLQQVFWNVLSNAIKFTGQGGTITVAATCNDAQATIRVADTGEGIEPEFLPHLFEPFRQADASTTRRQGGLGLGLAIVSQIVHAHGGTVAAASAGKGQGTCITIELPTRRRSVPPRAPALNAAKSDDAIPSVRLDELRLLVVDDEEDARALLSQVLTERGAKVSIAASASEALAKLQSHRPDVLISDIAMPDVDGYRLIEQIRRLSQEDGGRVPAIALSAYSRADDVTRALAAGFQLHVVKPADPATLLASVAALAGRQAVD